MIAPFSHPARTASLALATVLAASAFSAPIGTKTASTPKQEAVQTKGKSAQVDQAALAAKSSEIKDLAAAARKVTQDLAVLAASGNLPTDDEALKRMQEMVDQLKQINERLEKLEGEVDELKGWKEGKEEADPIIANDIADLKRNRPTTYVQVQYRDSDQVDRAGEAAGQHAFALRRIRIGTQATIDPKTLIRVSFDLATGTDNTSAQLRDAILQYSVVPSDVQMGTEILAGQVPLPLGYELERSSADREFPERATYNRRMWDGERVRGVYVRHGLSPNSHVFAGVASSLSFNDPEQRGKGPAPFGRLAGFGGIRYYSTNYDFGIGFFQGDRPRYEVRDSRTNNLTGFSPEVDRRFIYLDASLVGVLLPDLLIRAEAMIGNDRVPSSTPRADRFDNPMSGWQAQIGYNLNPLNQVFLRYAQFDPNKDRDFDAVREYGIAYRHYINQGASLTFAWEFFEDPSLRDNTYTVRTLRYQFRF